MKPVAVFFVIALVPAAVMMAHAKTLTSSQGGADQKSVAGVAGPAMAAQDSSRDKSGQVAASQSGAQPSKKALKKAKVTPPPPMHDPN